MRTLTAIEYLCHEIAIALGDDWAFQPSEDGWYANLIRHNDGLNIFCRTQGKRLYISPESTEKGIDPNYDRPVITVDSNKPPGSIARDIQSRLLPSATTWWADSQAKLAERKAEDDAVAAFDRQIQQLTGKTKSPSSKTFYGEGWQCNEYCLATDLTFRGLTHNQTLALLRTYYKIKGERQ